MKIGPYELGRLLGKGGMSEVWEAENPRLGLRRAVKVYAFSRESDEVRARFEQEGRMLVRLRHPRIVGVDDFGTTEDGRPYFAMDLVLNPEGNPQTLADVEDGSVDEETIARWYDDLREGLVYIHAKGIVHRDLKLQNCLVGPDGHVVLTDFGISHVGDAVDGGGTIVDPVQTVVQVREGKTPVMGSLGYLAPELEMGLPATERSDWYALGVLVYRLLTGTWCDARTDLARTLDSFDPAWRRILPALLHANPQARACPSFAETRAELKAAEDILAETRLDVAEGAARRARRFAFSMGAVAAVLAGAVLYGGYAYRAQRQTWRMRMARTAAAVPTFDELFVIPAAAKAEPLMDADGNVTMPSRSQFGASRVDALVLTHSLFASLAGGRVTVEKVVAAFEDMAEALTDPTRDSPLLRLEFGGVAYMQMGDDDALRFLLQTAAERLRVVSDE